MMIRKTGCHLSWPGHRASASDSAITFKSLTLTLTGPGPLSGWLRARLPAGPTPGPARVGPGPWLNRHGDRDRHWHASGDVQHWQPHWQAPA